MLRIVIELEKEIVKMVNYTRPYNKNYEDTPEDYLYLAMAFSQTLDCLLAEGQGVFIELSGDALKLKPETKKVIVFNDSRMIRVIKSDDENLKHGDRVIMIDKNIIGN